MKIISYQRISELRWSIEVDTTVATNGCWLMGTCREFLRMPNATYSQLQTMFEQCSQDQSLRHSQIANKEWPDIYVTTRPYHLDLI